MDSVGSDVPEDIQNILNLGPENIQGQHDGPFWFNLSAGDVAKNLNRITNLELIDSTIQKLNERVRKATYGLGSAEDNLKKAKEQFEELSYVPDLAKEFSYLEELDAKIFDVKDEIEWLGKKNKASREYTETINSNTQFLSDSEELMDLAEEIIAAEKPLIGLGKLIKNIMDLEEKIKEVPDITPLESIVVDIRTTSSEMADIKYRLREVWDRQKSLKQATTEYRHVKNELMDELGNRCPLCGGKLNESDRSIVL
jgi:septal ring factor EnvC (AmiA/AmiB activator)